MGRHKKNRVDLIADEFSACDLAVQDTLLIVLGQINRQAKRQTSKRWSTGPDILGESSIRAMEEQGRIDGMDGTPK